MKQAVFVIGMAPVASTGPPSIEGGMRLPFGSVPVRFLASTGPPSIEGGMRRPCRPRRGCPSRFNGAALN